MLIVLGRTGGFLLSSQEASLTSSDLVRAELVVGELFLHDKAEYAIQHSYR